MWCSVLPTGDRPVLIGMIHLPPISPHKFSSNYSIQDVVAYAVNEGEKLEKAGFDGFIVENYMDYPFSVKVKDAYTLGFFSIVAYELRKQFPKMQLGINILRNSGVEAVEISCLVGADFIRVNAYLEPIHAPEGHLEPIARQIWEKKKLLNCHVKIFSDINVKHSKPIMSFQEAVRDTCTRGLVDAIILTGTATGQPPDPSLAIVARKNCRRNVKIFIGSGISLDNIGLFVDIVDGFIIGTAIKQDKITTNPIDQGEAERIVVYVEKVLSRLR